MDTLITSGVVFGCVLASTLAAMLVSKRLPEHYLNNESKDAIKLGLGVIATMTALVLGLLVAATKGTYDTQNTTVKELAGQLALLDRVLSKYGPEAAEARNQVKLLTHSVLDQVWPQAAGAHPVFIGGLPKATGETLFDMVAALDPKTDTQRLLRSRSLDIIVGLGNIRQRLVMGNASSIPLAFLVLLGFWEAVLFAGYGLLVPRNAMTITVLIVCMLSVSAALFLILELDRPFEGTIRISDAPVQLALSHLGE